MAWIDPKTTWAAGQAPTKDDFNRIEGNTQDLKDNKLDKTGGILAGTLTAQSNTNYATRQVRNIIISPDNPVLSQMQDGDIWIKYR